MRTKGFGAWPPKNILSGGQQAPRDPFNKAQKGSERAPRAEEYASAGIEQYHHYDQFISAEEFAERQRQKQSSGSKDNTRSARQRVLSRVVGVVVGSVVVVTTYQSMAQRQEQQQKPADVPAVVQPSEDVPVTPPETDVVVSARLSPEWTWSEDKRSVTVALSDADGNLVTELPASVSVSEEAATCTKEGLRTFTATVEYEDNEYSDTQTEPIEPLGHDFGEGKEIILENGQRAMTFTCARCHEEFTFTISMTEND